MSSQAKLPPRKRPLGIGLPPEAVIGGQNASTAQCDAGDDRQSLFLVMTGILFFLDRLP